MTRWVPASRSGRAVQGEGLIVSGSSEAALRETLERYRRLLEAVTSYRYTVCLSNGRATSTEHGPGCEAVTGYTPSDYAADSGLWFTMIHPDDRQTVLTCVAEVTAGRSTPPLEHRIIHRSGETRWVRDTMVPHRDARGNVVCYDGLVEDITDRRRTEQELAAYRDHLEELVDLRTTELAESRAQLRQSERLASIGTLATGIAHEINNPVGAVLIAAQNALELRSRPGGGDLLDGCLRDIIDNARRCGRIVENVLQFARHAAMPKVPGDLNEIVSRGVDLTRRYVEDNGALLHLELGENLPAVTVNAVAIEQVVVNLIRNAVEAGQPQVKVRVGTESLGQMACIVVGDDGPGISRGQQPYLFDPFFTTRRSRGGTGLGLSIVHGIVTEHDGRVDVISEPGAGTTVRVELPLHPADATEDPNAAGADRR